MSFCPIDGKPYPDDLCHGGGCVQSGFSLEMEERCTSCKGLYPRDEMIYGVCMDCREDYDEF